MGISSTLSRYVARQYSFWLLSVFLGLSALVSVFDVVELLRRSSSKDVSLPIVLQMAAAKFPFLAQELLPFAVLFAAMIAFWRMAKSNEIVVAKAAGVSVWQLLIHILVITLFIGIFQVTVFSPFASNMNEKYDQLQAKHLNHKTDELSISENGIWLRQGHSEGQAVIRADMTEDNGQILKNVTIYILKPNNTFVSRIDAKTAVLKAGYWEVADAKVANEKGFIVDEQMYRLPTSLTTDRVQDSFLPADSLSFWALPDFIKALESAGFDASKHQLRYQVMLAIPFLLCAMVLIAATFSMRVNRRANTNIMILGGVVCGFLLYLLTNVVHALGLSTNVPIILAAWTPAGVSMLLGVTVLLHLEDG